MLMHRKSPVAGLRLDGIRRVCYAIDVTPLAPWVVSQAFNQFTRLTGYCYHAAQIVLKQVVDLLCSLAGQCAATACVGCKGDSRCHQEVFVLGQTVAEDRLFEAQPQAVFSVEVPGRTRSIATAGPSAVPFIAPRAIWLGLLKLV